MDKISFAVTWDYRCPFARNAHEHLIAGLEDGAPWEVEFLPFSLSQAHVAEGGTPVWDDPAKAPDLLSMLAGIVVRDRFPEHFLAVHGAFFAARHDQAADLRRTEAVAQVLEAHGVPSAEVFAEIDAGWPAKELQRAHEAAVRDHEVFGVPTFIAGPHAAFARVMTRPAGDAELARTTIDRVVDLLVGHPDLNEFKHTTIGR